MDSQPTVDHNAHLSEQVQKDGAWMSPEGSAEGPGICAICLEKIIIQETALVKGCEHAFCVTCILRWATYNQNPCCPQCKLLFGHLNVHRSLDGSIHDYMFEESVCLLLRATWFVPLTVDSKEAYEEPEDLSQYYPYDHDYDIDDDEDDLSESYYHSTSSSIRIGNRRWGDNGYVRAGRKEARPSKKKEASGGDVTGRRAKRALKREAADKQQEHRK